jgi:trans-aconitate 2-methyltransferase
MPSWDPQVYGRYAAERARPFADLLARVDPEAPRTVVDLGCGTGELTASLARRWPDADVLGVDSSPAMLERAARVATPAGAPGNLRFEQGDAADWAPTAPVDVLVSNALLQWLPGHLDLLQRWLDAIAPGGWLALQVPGNFGSPSHALMREVAALPRFAERLDGVLRGGESVGDPLDYAAALAGPGRSVDAWETTYLHVLDPAGEHGDDAVLAWVEGTGLRPVTDALANDPASRRDFLDTYTERLRAAYPRRSWGTPLPFRRVFAVAHREPAPRDGTEPDVLVAGLHHVQLSCPAGSEDALRAFYGGVLGMREVAKPPALAARGGVWFRTGGCELHCGVEEGFVPARKAHPGIAVHDVDAAARRVRAAGGDVRWDDQLPGVRRFHTDDPVGNRVELQQV